MFAKNVMLIAVTAVAMVTANPLFQAIASQSCPICEKSALKNQLQNLFFQAANNFQPYPPICMNQNPVQVQPALPSKRSCPVHSQGVQNRNFQVPTYQQPPTNQPYCPYTSQNVQQQGNPLISEAMNKILSNPSLKSILDPNIKLFNQNGLEIPRNGPCNNGSPQVINNYIIVPPEFLLDDKKTAADKKPHKERRKKINNANESKRRISKPINTVRENRGRKVANPEPFAFDNTIINQRIPIDGERQTIRRQKVKKPEIKVNVVNQNTIPKPQVSDTIVVTIEEPKRQSEKEIVNTSTTTDNQRNTEQITATSLTDKNEDSDNKTENPNGEKLLKENLVINTVKVNQDSEQKPASTKTKEAIQIQVHNLKDNKRVANNPRKSTKIKSKVKPPRNYNPREQAVVNDFKRRFPDIPEDVVVNLLNHMKSQLMSQNIGFPPFYYPQMPMSFDQYYGNQFAPMPSVTRPENGKKSSSARKSLNSDQTSSKRRKSNTRRRKPKKTTTPEPCNAVVELTPTVEVTTEVKNEIESTTLPTKTTTERPIIAEKVPTTTSEMPIIPEIINTTTTENPIIAEMVTESINDEACTESNEVHPIESTTPTANIEIKSHENTNIKEIKKEITLPELGSEDVVPTIYLNELDDEYYPDFTGDLQYYSDEDLQYFGLEDDRYHYTTDKNFPLEELNRARRRLNARANNDNPYPRRPQDRHVFRIQNWERARPNARLMNQRRRPKFRTSPRPRPENNNVTPKIKILVKENLDVKTDSVKTNTEKSKSEVIEFRTPPTLEFIDFETKPINKEIYFHDYHKTSSYSDMKTPHYHLDKNIDQTTKLNPKQKSVDQIQTHHAGSKVAIYGSPVFRNLDADKDQFENEDKIIVMAKSVNGDYW